MKTTLLTLTELAERAQVDRATVWRWVRRGVKVSGQQVTLGADRIGGQWRSDQERLDAFLAECQGFSLPSEPAPSQSVARRQRQHERDRAEARAKGLL